MIRWLCRTMLVWCSVLALGTPSWALTDEEVGAAIERYRQVIYAAQGKDGSWQPPGEVVDINATGSKAQYGGATALITYALLVSGESSQRPEIERAINYLRELSNAMPGTYARSLRNHVWGQLPDSFQPMMKLDTDWLLEAAYKNGTFTYTSGAGKELTGDHSCSQYGLLGLWEGAKRNVRISPSYWERAIEHWLKTQNDDGGWQYSGGGPDAENKAATANKSTFTMSAAGLTALLVAQQEFLRNEPKPNRKVSEAIGRGLVWMDKNFTGSSGMYGMYGLERVALASGVKDLNGKDWYATGAASMVRNPRANPDGAFALAFLARGRVPVWITKLAIPGQAWNNRPNDIYFLTHFLSNYREGELNWQVLDINRSAEEMRSTPLLYLASDQALNLTIEQQEKLRRTLDLGGMLLLNPDGNSPAFMASVRKLAETLYPHYRLRPVDPKHPILNAHYQLAGVSPQSILVLNNGVRDLMIVTTRDWGMAFQAEDGAARSGNHWKLITNLFVYATDRGVLENRLVERIELRSKRPATATLIYGRARYNGSWCPEPLAWQPLANHLFNRTGLDLIPTPSDQTPITTTPRGAKAAAGAETPAADEPAANLPPEAQEIIDLAKIDACNLKFIHLSGSKPVRLTPQELEAIKTYTQRGGTILVESVGGNNLFAQEVEEQLRGVLTTAAVPLLGDHAIISGKDTAGRDIPGAYDNRNVNYRRYTVWGMSTPSRRPRLAAFYVNGRAAVLISQDDLSLGLLDVRHWGIIGYTPESAKRLYVNLVLYANQGNLSAQPSSTTATGNTPATQPATVN